MAAKKKKPNKKPTQTPRQRRGKRRAMHLRRLRARRFDPAVRRWRLFTHDVDTLLHELVRNPALAEADAAALVARAEAFADAIRAMHDRRRPKGLSEEWDG